MGYMHIQNLYKNQRILMFRRCWALEKVHGTGGHVSYHAGDHADPVPRIDFHAHGGVYLAFVDLFDRDQLLDRFARLGYRREVRVFGEVYGGRVMGMRETYGDAVRFIAFDVRVGDTFLSVPEAALVSADLGIEFVPFVEVSTDLAELDAARDAPSVVAERRGRGSDREREGVILRPLVEVLTADTDARHRICAKHKRASFSECATPQKVVNQEQLAVLTRADEIARQWVTPMRLTHVVDGLPGPAVTDMFAARRVIAAMVEDVYREGAGEVVASPEATQAIGRRTSELLQQWLRDRDRADEETAAGEQLDRLRAVAAEAAAGGDPRRDAWAVADAFKTAGGDASRGDAGEE